MAVRNPYSPLVVPGDWTGTMRNFGVKLSQIITDIYLRLTQHSEDTDKLKEQTVGIAETAIIVNGNTSAERIAKNAYVIVRNSTIEDRPDGIYKSGSTIEAGTTITASMLSARTIGAEMKYISDSLGSVSNLTTTDKTSAVAAINELAGGKISKGPAVVYIGAGQNTTLSLDNLTRHLIIVCGPNSGLQTIVIATCTSIGSITYNALSSPSYLSFTTSTNGFKVSNTHTSSTCFVYDIPLDTFVLSS